ncbi:MAG: M23 family metallopeptidase [Bacteroidota bacterium]
MIPLSEFQVQRIAEDLTMLGFSYQALEEELLDHVCCGIEAKMADGQSFESAYEDIMQEFGPKGMLHVEKQTLHLLTKEQRNMKRLSLLAVGTAALLMTINLSGLAQSVPSLKPLDGEIISNFGMRTHPIKKVKQHHRGVDFKADFGTPIKATAEGKVLKAGVDPNAKAYGIKIEIEHAEGYTTLFAHLQEAKVKAGDTVKAGDIIGLVGSTGRSKGPHLHYEVRKDNKPVNPANYMPEG